MAHVDRQRNLDAKRRRAMIENADAIAEMAFQSNRDDASDDRNSESNNSGD